MDLSRRDFLAAAAAAGALPLLSAFAVPASDSRLRATVDALAEDYLASAPETATNLGLDAGARAPLASRLDDLSGTGVARRAAIVDDYARRIAAIDPAALDPRDRILHDSVAYALDLGRAGKAFAYGRNGFGDAMNESAGPYVVDQSGSAYANLPELLDSKQRVTNAGEAEAYLTRLAGFAGQLDQEDEQVRRDAAAGVTPPDFIVDNILKQLTDARALPAAGQRVVVSLAKKAAAAGIAGDWAGRAGKIVMTQIYPALDRQIATLRALRPTHDAGVWSLPQGDAYYAWLLRVGTTTTLDAKAIHQTGLDQVAAIEAELEPLLRGQGLTRGSVGERLMALDRDPRQFFADSDEGRAELLAYLRGLIDRNRARMPQLSKLDLKAPVLVKRVPVDIQDGAPQGYMNFAAIDGSRPAIYYINLKSMGNWPRGSLGTLTAHEAIPGHAWQGAYLAEHAAEVPLIDSLMGFNAFIEGWALYAERMADEIGCYDGDPASRIGYLRDQLLRAVRLVVDTGLHDLRWSREQAIDWMRRHTGDAPDGTTSEIDRYCATPGQACGYKIGQIEILRLRDKARKAMGARFDLRDFNDAIVRTAGVPITVLETAIDMYIAGNQS
jgi:uncharacterized protein (DUF885 family)